VHIQFPGTEGNQFIMYLSLGAACSRFAFGIISDHPKINAIILQQVTRYKDSVHSRLLVYFQLFCDWLTFPFWAEFLNKNLMSCSL
jgi:hypothetical protein